MDKCGKSEMREARNTEWRNADRNSGPVGGARLRRLVVPSVWREAHRPVSADSGFYG